MHTIIIIKNNGDISEKNIKQFNEDEVYKICKYKTNKDFLNIHNFQVKRNTYKLYSKTTGRAGNENKYELPPPIDNDLYFGTICIIKIKNDEVHDLSCKEWEEVYEELFGGFEDIGENDSDERSMDSSIYSDEEYTKEGYLKDNFVIEDGELEEEDYLSYEED